MRGFRDLSIRHKLTAIIMVTSSVALLVACAAFAVYDWITFRRAIARDLSAVAEMVAANSSAAVAFHDPDSAKQILQALRAEKPVVAACIYTSEGRPFATYLRGQPNANFSPPSPREQGFEFSSNRLNLFRRISLGGDTIGTVYLQADLEQLWSRLGRFVGIVTLVLVAASFVAYLLSSRLQRLISDPIQQLASTAKLVSVEKNYSIRAAKHGQDELGQLIEGFNEMLAQIQHRDTALQKGHDELEHRVEERTHELQQKITERNEAEAVVREWKDRYEAAVQASGHLLYDWDHRRNEVTYSGNLEKILGYSREEMPGGRNHWLQVVHPEDRATFRKGIDRVLATKEPLHLEYRVRRKDGSYIVVQDDGNFVLDLSGNIVRMVGFVVDVTEQRTTETQLRQALKMEAVGQLAGGVAHDFNNLLGVIIGYSEILTERLEATHPLRNHAEQIKNAGNRAASLTRQLLAFSRQQVLQPKVIDLNSVVAEMGKMLRRLIREDIELTTVQDPALGQVKADPGQIEQVIMNLAVNARDAMPHGGKLTIETTNSKLDDADVKQRPYVRPGRFVLVTVSDTGVGMNAETQARIFEPFFTTKEVGKGTGLGLATVYGIVKQSDGFIWVYSEVGKGTTFKIYLPRVDQLVEATEASREQSVPGGSETILLVEDAEPLRKLAREILQSSGYTVLDTGHSAEALQIADLHKGLIHLLLTDVVMPGMGGRQLAECLTRLCPQIKVLYMSGYTDVHRGMLDPDGVLLEKPFTRAALTGKVREVLGRVKVK